jgi:hypothetical protein
VSEERGTISVARQGELTILADKQSLVSILESFYGETVPQQERKPWKEFFRRNYKEKAIAVCVTIVLWFVFVVESRMDYRSFTVPVQWTTHLQGLTVKKIDPPQVELTFSGPRRLFLFVDESDIAVMLRIIPSAKQAYSRTISESSILFPDGLTFESSEPPTVSVEIASESNAE